jgi:hypothetical protein
MQKADDQTIESGVVGHSIYVLADKYSVDELVNGVGEQCQARFLAANSTAGITELEYIYKNTRETSELRDWVVTVAVRILFWDYKKQPVSFFKDWKEFKDYLHDINEIFKKDWKDAIRKHLNEIDFSDCDIPRCYYHDRYKFAFVFASVDESMEEE